MRFPGMRITAYAPSSVLIIAHSKHTFAYNQQGNGKTYIQRSQDPTLGITLYHRCPCTYASWNECSLGYRLPSWNGWCSCSRDDKRWDGFVERHGMDWNREDGLLIGYVWSTWWFLKSQEAYSTIDLDLDLEWRVVGTREWRTGPNRWMVLAPLACMSLRWH